MPVPYICKHYDLLEDQHRYIELYSIIHNTAGLIKGGRFDFLLKFSLDHLWFHAVCSDGAGDTTDAKDRVLSIARSLGPDLVVDPSVVIRGVPKIPLIKSFKPKE